MAKINPAAQPQHGQFSVSPTLGINQLALEKRREGEEVFHLGFGESPFPAHPMLAEKLAKYASHSEYVHTAGLPKLRNQVRRYYTTRLNLDPDRYDVVIAPGSKLLLLAAQFVLEGDVLLPNPSWVSYAPQARMLNQVAVWLRTVRDDEGYHIDLEKLKKKLVEVRKQNINPTKIIINTPNNPTGLVIPRDELKELAALCREEDLTIISDEIYGFTQYNGQHTSIARFAPERTIVTAGLSKHQSLGGWRLGMALVPKDIGGLFVSMNNFASETWSCVSTPIQYAAVEAYSEAAEIQQHEADSAAIHQIANTYLAKQLAGLGIDCPIPQGAFYMYPDFDFVREQLVKKEVTTSFGLSHHLAHNYNIMALPGAVFGAKDEELTLRLAGCDYDGEAALSAYQAANGKIDEAAFVKQYMPRIAGAAEGFTQFLKNIS